MIPLIDGEPENIPMYPYEMNSRLSSLRMLDYSAQPVPEAVYSDLDPVEREHLRSIIQNYHGEKTLLDLDDTELDLALRLAIEQNGVFVPTYCGMLLNILERTTFPMHLCGWYRNWQMPSMYAYAWKVWRLSAREIL